MVAAVGVEQISGVRTGLAVRKRREENLRVGIIMVARSGKERHSLAKAYEIQFAQMEKLGWVNQSINHSRPRLVSQFIDVMWL
jgi:hypothetical protein